MSVVLEDLSRLSVPFQLARRDEYEAVGIWADADGVCDDSVGVMMGS